MGRRLAVLLVVAAAFAIAAPFANAGTWGVDDTTDTPVGQACPGLTGCSLREAVTSTEANPGPDEILVNAGTYTLTNGQLDVTQDLTIANAGTDPATISGGDSSRILYVDGGAEVTLRLLTLTDGNDTEIGAPAQGGAIYGDVATVIHIESTTVSNSSATSDFSAEGGGIWSEGAVTLGMAGGSTTPSVVSGNTVTATGDGSTACGGGIAMVDSDDLTVGPGTSIDNNHADGPTNGLGHGGGVWFSSDFQEATFDRATIFGNTTTTGSGGASLGAGIDLEFGSALFTRSTISGNTATGPDNAFAVGGGIAVTGDQTTLDLTLSTVAENTAEVTAAGSFAGGGGVGVLGAPLDFSAKGSTISANAVSAVTCSCVAGPGVLDFSASGQSLQFAGTILAGNTGDGQRQCESALIQSGGYNVLGPLPGCGYIGGPGDRVEVKNPKLKPLGNFGGLTETMMPMLGSPALDLIPAADALCTSETTDQRGSARPQGGNCDSGAVEAMPATLDLDKSTVSFPYALPSTSTTDTLTVTNNGELDAASPSRSLGAPFSATGCTSVIAAGASCTLDLTFSPAAAGAFGTKLKLKSGRASATASLNGVGWAPTTQPAIPGTPSVGYQTYVNTGRWPAPVASFSLQWQRCASDGTGCADIPGTHLVFRPAILGSTRATYTPVLADAGHTLRVRLTAKSSTGVVSDEVKTAASAVVTRTIPTILQGPYIERAASPTVGTTLYANHGQWTGAPDSYTYEWHRCDADGVSNCGTVVGTKNRYTPVVADSGHALRVKVVATNPAGSSAPATSAPSGVVS